MRTFENGQPVLPGLTDYDLQQLNREIDNDQPTLPGLTDQDMAWLDPAIIELSTGVDLGDTRSLSLLESVRAVEADIANRRKR